MVNKKAVVMECYLNAPNISPVLIYIFSIKQKVFFILNYCRNVYIHNETNVTGFNRELSCKHVFTNDILMSTREIILFE